MLGNYARPRLERFGNMDSRRLRHTAGAPRYSNPHAAPHVNAASNVDAAPHAYAKADAHANPVPVYGLRGDELR